MTIKEAYETALGLDATTSAKDDSLADSVVNITNVFLAETFDNENAYRLVNHMSPLNSIPRLTSINDTVPYNAKLINAALPFFIAHQQMKAGDDNTWASRYYDMYLNSVNAATPLLPDDGRGDCWR